MIGPVVRRQMMLAEAAAAGEQARWQRQQDETAERSAEERETAALAAAQYRAESAGDHYDALAIARGAVPPRTLADVLGEAMSVPERVARDLTAEYGSEANPAMLVDGQELPPPVRRAADWPSSEAELDRMLGQAEDAHREYVAYRARTGYPRAEAEARRKAEGGHAARSQSAPLCQARWTQLPPAAAGVPLGYYDADPGKITRGTANAVTGIW